jgi:hypothetical protein
LTTNTAAAQLMSTCVPNSPERRGEIGCSIIESKLLPDGLKEPGTSIASTLRRRRGQPLAPQHEKGMYAADSGPHIRRSACLLRRHRPSRSCRGG